jgi:hypothetical protein
MSKKKPLPTWLGADNGLFIYRGCCFRPLSPPWPGIGNDTDDKNYERNKIKDDKIFHLEFDLLKFGLVLTTGLCPVKYYVYISQKFILCTE